MIPKILDQFIGPNQKLALRTFLNGEEKEWFKQKLESLARMILTMPKTYQTDGQGDRAIVYLHFFAGGQANWYVTEKDSGSRQIQAFGRADLFGDGGELGYINIEEILDAGGDLDLHWTLKTLAECRK